MLTAPQMFRDVPPERDRYDSPVPLGNVNAFDWDARLSIEAIRDHTKTSDVPGVTDDQLRLYRAAAVEAAEFYTGLLLSGQRMISEPCEGPASIKPGKHHYKHRLKYPSVDGFIYLYGAYHPEDNRAFRTTPGTRVIQIPARNNVIDLTNCCDPCSTYHINGGMLVTYKAGYASPSDVPAGVVVGMLQFIAWILEHPGDELVTQRNRRDATAIAGGISGSNNIAMVSGALESWRQYDESAW